MGWSKEEIVAATGGKILRDGARDLFADVVTDSTRAEKGSVFVALKGERLDGHRFVADAVRRGATCVVVHKRVAPPRPDVTVIRVADTLRALGDLARYRRRQYGPKVLAVTGSNGKTTTKEMLAAILERARWKGRSLRGRVLKTEGNLNNLVGLPLTLLRLRPRDAVAVVELGTNRPGEIARLAEIAEPDMGIITSVAPAHLEGLDGMAGVAREKGALFRGVRPGGKIAVNLDDPWVRRLSRGFAGEKITYGKRGRVRAEPGAAAGPDGMRFVLRLGRSRRRVRLGFVGRHNIGNALGAAAMAYGFGAGATAIREGLERARPFAMRMELRRWRGAAIINDAYNANPASMAAALEALREMPCRGERSAVLGDMLELGRESRRHHVELGGLVARLGIDRLYLLGRYAAAVKRGAMAAGMAEERIRIGRSHDEIAGWLRGRVRRGDWLLFKGSRGMRMETVLQKLTGGEA
ncbi:MAG TPA: UDP-N-acetylmuramoyl-tripeptide--D-alanyl-D-alanine ligase [candidate division Zixibacteria bacterium]|nr:UDP-N-acetylmuramoyl-tripeptide--D-alanyl-D-alanine ligase [candidate division Zixibacteria bacterium]